MISRLCILKKTADECGEKPLEELYTMKNLKSQSANIISMQNCIR